MKTILVPSDFSKNATTALRYAIGLAKATKSKLVIFHCAHLAPYILASAAATDKQLELLISQDQDFKKDKLLSQVAAAYKSEGIKKIPATTEIIVESKPFLADNIIDVAERFRADIIIMGTHGATGLNRFFFGSNTATMISRSSIPVLAIPEKYRFKKINNIVCSSDLENPGNELNKLLPFVQALKANLDLLYLDYGIDISQAHVQAAKISIGKCGYKKVKLLTRRATVEYSLIRQLKKYLATHQYEWLVMFTKDRKFWDKLLFGGKTEAMSYSLKMPLLSFKK
jgi:nucleotide-binding universal stress UspA family protein